MKLAFTTLGNPDWSFDKTLAEAQRLGFQAIEVRGVEGKMPANEIPQFFPENQNETKKKLAEYNLVICGFGTSVSFHDSNRFDSMIAEGKTAIDVCAGMDIPFIRVFGDKITAPYVRDETIKRVIDGIKELCEYASDKSIKVLLEVHGDFNTIENVMDVVNEVKSCPEFGILWDVAHSDRSYGDDFIDFYNVIKPFISHVHIKDHLRENGNFKLCLVGEGDIPLRKIVKTLLADGYTGHFTLEWEKKWHPQLPEPEVAYPGCRYFLDVKLGIACERRKGTCAPEMFHNRNYNIFKPKSALSFCTQGEQTLCTFRVPAHPRLFQPFLKYRFIGALNCATAYEIPFFKVKSIIDIMNVV